MIAQEQDIDIKQELKRIKKRVKQLEAQRELVRAWEHKAELLDLKKQKLKYKEALDKNET
jgi:hypothetical protein|tara:strand:+ start:4484 stop:4663 length:180 start_codon:yes stop_codon:yes gene_type:complete